MKRDKKLQAIYDDTVVSSELVKDFEPEDYKCYFVTGLLFVPIIKKVGRVVQVREEAGAFGSHQVFMRCCDGNLQCHENQWYYKVPERLIPQLDELFAKMVDEDNGSNNYMLRNESGKVGFIIPSEVKEGESTPMREVQNAIMGRIAEILDNGTL